MYWGSIICYTLYILALTIALLSRYVLSPSTGQGNSRDKIESFFLLE